MEVDRITIRPQTGVITFHLDSGAHVTVQFHDTESTAFEFCLGIAIAQNEMAELDYPGADVALQEFLRTKLQGEVVLSTVQKYWRDFRNKTRLVVKDAGGSKEREKEVTRACASFSRHREHLFFGPRIEENHRFRYPTIEFDPSPPSDLVQAIQDYLSQRMLGLPFPGEGPKLNELGLPIYSLVGRKDPLEDAVSAILDRGVRTITISGCGGVGKTRFARDVIRSVTAKFPDAHIEIDLLATSVANREPLDAEGVAIAIARKLSGAEIDPGGRATEQLATIAGKTQRDRRRVAVLLDDAGGGHQVADVVRLLSEECFLKVVTSRPRIGNIGSRHFALTPLKRDESIQLLRERCERLAESQAREIAGCCGDLPQALHLVACTLSSQPALDADKYLRVLKQHPLQTLDDAADSAEQRITTIIRTSLDMVRDHSPLRADRWLLLAVIPHLFDDRAAAAVWSEDEDFAHVELGALHQSGLVMWNEAAERFLLHDLFRSYAWDELEPAIRFEAGKRFAMHFKTRLEEAESIHTHQSITGGLALFDEERSNIEHAFAWACKRSEPDMDVLRLRESMPHVGTEILHLRQGIEDRLLWREQALKAARSLDDRLAEAHHLAHLCRAYDRNGESEEDFEAAIDLASQALAIAEEFESDAHECEALDHRGNALRHLGSTLKKNGDLKESRKATRAALEDHQRMKDLLETCQSRLDPDEHGAEWVDLERRIGRALGLVGNAHDRLGHYRKGERAHRESIEVGERCSNNARNVAVAYGNLGQSIRGQANGDPAEAIAAFRKRIDPMRDLGDVRGEAIVRFDLGKIQKAVDPDAAGREQQLARELFLSVGDKRRADQAKKELDELGISVPEDDPEG